MLYHPFSFFKYTNLPFLLFISSLFPFNILAIFLMAHSHISTLVTISWIHNTLHDCYLISKALHVAGGLLKEAAYLHAPSARDEPPEALDSAWNPSPPPEHNDPLAPQPMAAKLPEQGLAPCSPGASRNGHGSVGGPGDPVAPAAQRLLLYDG